MSNGWQTKADVLRDLSEVNGRRTGADELDRHVVAGERPPPFHPEIPDEDEMSYFSGGHRAAAVKDGMDPDLDGISNMLKMVNDMDETVSHNDMVTLYRNRVTDEIRISKLNPYAGEYVPGGNTNTRDPRDSPIKNNKKHRTRNNGITVTDNVGSSHSITPINATKQNGLPTFHNMFKSKSEKHDKINATVDGNTAKVTASEIRQKEVNPISLPMFKSKSEKDDEINATANGNTAKVTESQIRIIPMTKPNLSVNGLQKRQIEKQDPPKADEITSKIASSTNNSSKTRRQKNVAVTTLLRLGNIPSEPIKLMKPDYFEKPPINKVEVDEDVEQVDPDSIKKVDSWFNSIECPKPKTQVQEKLVLKDSVTFKKKTPSSVTSRNTSTSKEEAPKEIKAFKPSALASDLLKKYETNAQRQEPSFEDLGTRLERQLKERDEVVRQRMLARQNAG